MHQTAEIQTIRSIHWQNEERSRSAIIVGDLDTTLLIMNTTSSIKNNQALICNNVQPHKDYSKLKKPYTKGHILYDSIYIK